MKLLAYPDSYAVHHQLKHNANSSSSHSVLLSNGAVKRVDNEDLGADPKTQEYGWSYFVLTTPQEKAAYAIQSAFHQRTDHNIALLQELLGVKYNPNGYVDHQSTYELIVPRVSEHDSVNHRKLFQVWKRYVIDNPNLVIVGGNDNDDGSYSNYVQCSDVSELSNDIARMYDCYDIEIIEDGGATIIFSAYSGKRIIIDWNKHGFPKLKMPALVDLKITDYCTYGCRFCYQGSTKNGNHVSIFDLCAIVDVLVASNVKELVVGGGEPTQHPDFREFLRYAKRKGLCVSFTTRSEEWIGSERDFWLDEITGNVAFSVTSLAEVKRIFCKFIASERASYMNRVQFQCIQGVTSTVSFMQILRYCFVHGLTLTMLGFKTTGRGANYDKRQHDDFVEAVSDFLNSRPFSTNVQDIIPDNDTTFTLLCDTKFAQDNRELMQKLLKDKWNFNVRQQFIFEEEGLVSCYIDPLKQVVMKSSYHHNDSFKYDTFTTQTFEQAWLEVRTKVD